MKQLFFVVMIIIISTVNLSAQAQKGAVLTGGSINFHGQKNSDEYFDPINNIDIEFKSTFFSIKPTVGYFISEKFLLGLGINYEYNYSKQTNYGIQVGYLSPNIVKSNILFLNPIATRYYKIINNLYFTSSLNLQIGFGFVKYEDNESRKSDVFEFRIEVVPGLTYFLSKKWALKGSIGQLFYSRRQEKFTDNDVNYELIQNIDDDYGVNLSFNTFSLGIQYYLNNEEKNMSVGSN